MSQYPFLLLLVSFHSPTSQIQLPPLTSFSDLLSWDASSWRSGAGCFIIWSSHPIWTPGCGDIWHKARAHLPDIFIGGAKLKRELSRFAARRLLALSGRLQRPGKPRHGEGGSSGTRGVASQRSSAAAECWHQPLAIYLHHPVNLIGSQWLDKWIGIMGQYTWHMWGSLEK